jgi:hypothetical protein
MPIDPQTCDKITPQIQDFLLLPPAYAGPWAQPIPDEGRQAILYRTALQVYRSEPAPLPQIAPLGNAEEIYPTGLLFYARRAFTFYRVTLIHKRFMPPGDWIFDTAPQIILFYDSHLQFGWNETPDEADAGGATKDKWTPTDWGQSHTFDTTTDQCCEIIFSARHPLTAHLGETIYETNAPWWRIEGVV